MELELRMKKFVVRIVRVEAAINEITRRLISQYLSQISGSTIAMNIEQ